MPPDPSAAEASLLPLDAHDRVRSVYVHVPFCRHRCGYCDFSIIANRGELVPRYLRALEHELAAAAPPDGKPLMLDTLYIGGGTPTLLSVAELSQLLELLARYFLLYPGAEYTFEANPDQFSREKQQLLAAAGVNRISLGVQSFDDRYLQLLERAHSSLQALRVLEQLREHFTNISLDLIFALPGQTLAHWEQTLAQALDLVPPHISTYALTYEKGTRFWGARAKGVLNSLDEELESEMYRATLSRLAKAGMLQYEISNFCLPDWHSRHNDVYWTGLPYHAFGPGASRFVAGQRETNHRSPFTWMKRLEAGCTPVESRDNLTGEQRARELFAIGLRRNRGVEKALIQRITQVDAAALLRQELDSLLARRWIHETSTHVYLTDQGRLFADAIASEVI